MQATISSPHRHSHATHHHALPIQTPPAFLPAAQPPSPSLSTLNDVQSHELIDMEALQQRLLEGFCSLLQLPMPTMTLKPFPPPHPDIQPTPPMQTSSTTAPRQKFTHLTQQPPRNMDTPNRSFPYTPMLQLAAQQTPSYQQTAAPMQAPTNNDELTAINEPPPPLTPAECLAPTCNHPPPHPSL